MVEFLCDPDVTGIEEEEEGVLDVYKREEGGGNGTARATRPLVFKKYGPEGAKGEVDVLTLEWRTKFACENVEGGGGGKEKGNWGFFTWFIIMLVSPFISPVPTIGKPLPSTGGKANTHQRIPIHSHLPHLRLLAQLQPLRRPRLGPPPPRRHHPRRPLPRQRLVAPRLQHRPGQRVKRRLFRRVELSVHPSWIYRPRGQAGGGTVSTVFFFLGGGTLVSTYYLLLPLPVLAFRTAAAAPC